jgi:hypothetical protein
MEQSVLYVTLIHSAHSTYFMLLVLNFTTATIAEPTSEKNSFIFRVIKPCTRVKIRWVCKLISRLLFQTRRISLARNQHEPGSKNSKLDMCPRNVAWISQDFMALYNSEDGSINIHQCENLRIWCHQSRFQCRTLQYSQATSLGARTIIRSFRALTIWMNVVGFQQLFLKSWKSSKAMV